MKTILLIYRQSELGEAWRACFSDQPGVRLVGGDITAVPCNAIVSPANSFGFMDGGLDLALCERFGWQIQDALQREINALSIGELLVGSALVIPTGDAHTPWLIAAPTMRVPMSFGIATSVNAYLAMKAILTSVKDRPDITTIAIPGLCTGVGRMPPQMAAKQMFAAYDEIVLGHRPSFEDFGDAQKHQLDLNPNGLIWDY